MSSSALPEGLDLSTKYAKAVGAVDGEGPVMRNMVALDSLTDRPIGRNDLNNIYDLFKLSGLKLRPTEPCFGSRIREDGTVGPFDWQTYAEVDVRIDSIAAALWKLELVPQTPDGYRFLGLYCKNSRDWMVAAEACFKTGVVIVPMYDTLGPGVVGYIQGQTGCQTVLVTQVRPSIPHPLPPIHHTLSRLSIPPRRSSPTFCRLTRAHSAT